MQLHTVYFICKLLYMFRVVSPHIIRSTVICASDDKCSNDPKRVEQLTDKVNCV